MFRALRSIPSAPLRQVRWNSTATTPPLMATLRADLKTAMRAKDTARLNVLRALISETNNAAKTSSPIETDIQLLSLIRKRAAASADAAEQFAAADRADLKAKEDEQITILEEYASHVKMLSTEELEAIVAQQIASIKEAGGKMDFGQILKAIFSKDGPLDGKPADRKQVASMVKQALA
ncbi:hypothetical protein N7493_004439 [Penicillium malachiteum]|uniref:Altered inheritance of mitochondria protein 41 n=1 Tax=Penicillium malachiteum TaxID=1324776 RepID=A0AAD6HNJ2_9EURO|nr:hypothetical protein N7493_004439 [Penicillium malachiteum]